MLLVLWLMVGYTLPNTVWQNVSAEMLIRRGVMDAHPLTALALASAMMAGLWATFARDARHAPWTLAVWLLMAVWASSYLFDPLGRGYTGVGAIRCAMVLAMAGGGLLCARLVKPMDLMAVVVLLAGVQAGYALVYFVQGRNLFYTYEVGRAGGTFGTPVHVYTLMLIALPMSLSLMRQVKGVGWRVLLGASIVLMMAALWLTYSRSAWLAMSIVLPLIIWALWRNRRLTVAVAVCMCLAFLEIYILRLAGTPGLQDTTAQARVDVWRMGWQMFRQNWLWGVGADNVRIRYTSTWRGYAVSTWYGAPENQLLLWLCERGIWGGLMGLFLVVSMYHRLRHLLLPVRWGFGGALLAIGILGMFQSVFGRLEEGVETVLLTAVWASLMREEVT
ncbi:MAG: O-antigen ligase family protein [Armatimonadota bacterium]